MKAEDGGNRDEQELETLVENITRLLEEGDREVYSREVIAEFKNPTHAGRMPDADGTGVADGLCMDTMEIYVKEDGGRITKCTFYTNGCGASIACGNRLARFVEGMGIEDVKQAKPSDIVSLLNGLPPDHEHCATLAIIALNNALRDLERVGRSKEART